MRLILGAILAGVLFVSRSFFVGPLDGSAWDVKVKRLPFLPLGKKDTLVFERGRFSSARMLASGYFPSGYDSGDLKEGSSWEVSQTREDGSVLTWRGRVRGNRIKGTLTHYTKNGRERRYSFKGRRKSF
ncbi:MAG: hypothetical protein COB53_11425 [Elusimicrobia bacterium]|nr:MAG: hypothetical protein COB53_11425 [Elusimicrobiota bacterium]